MNDKLTVGELVYKISGDMENLKTELKKSEAEISKLKDSMEKTQKSTVGLNNAFKLIKGTIIAVASSAILRMIGGLAKTGAEVNSLQQSFGKLSAGLNIDSKKLLDSLNKLSGGTIANKDLMLSANRAMVLGVAKNMEEFNVLMQTARLRARDLGLSTTQAFNDIVTGIGRSSPLILDNLGIVIKQDEAYRAYATSLGKTTDALTENEKREALKFAVLKAGREEIARAGEITNSYADDIALVGKKVTDLKDNLGMALLPAMKVLVTSLGLTGATSEETAVKVNFLAKTLYQVANGLVAIGIGFKSLGSVIKIGYKGVENGIRGTVLVAVQSNTELLKRFGVSEEFLKNWNEALSEQFTDTANTIVGEFEKLGKNGEEFDKKMGQVFDPTEFEGVTAEYVQSMLDLKKGMEDIGSGVSVANEELEAMQQNILGLLDSSKELSKTLQEDFSKNLEETGKGLAEIYVGAQEEIKRLKKELSNTDDADTEKEIRAEIKKQEEILKARKGFEERQAEQVKAIREKLAGVGFTSDELDKLIATQTLEEQITEQRRLNALDEFTKFEELQNAKLEKIVSDIVVRREMENELTTFLQSQDVMRQASVESFANEAIKKYDEMAKSLRTAISLQAQLNAMRSGGKQFHSGGYVGADGGEVHAGEYVIPANMVSKFGSLVSALESERSGSVSNRTVNAPINITANNVSGLDMSAISKELAWELNRK